MPNNKTQQVILRYDKSDSKEIMTYLFEIIKQSNTKKSIDATLIKSFIGLFEFEGSLELNERTKHLQSIRQAFMAEFSNRSKYNFTFSLKHKQSDDFVIPDEVWKSENLLPPAKKKRHLKTVTITYNLDNCINNILSLLLLDKDYKKVIRKKEFLIQLVYKGFNDYFPKEQKRPISDYSILVMTGFIAAQFRVLKYNTREEVKEKPNPKQYFQELANQAKHYAKDSKPR